MAFPGHMGHWPLLREHPRCREYRDVISNGPFSIATADTDREGRIHNSALLPFVQVMTLGNVIY